MKKHETRGRPQKYGVATRDLHVRIPKPLNDRLDAEVERQGVTRTDVVIQTLNENLPREEK